MIDVNASVIFGYHTYVIQGIEFTKEAPIFYGLGDFVFHGVDVLASQLGSIRNYPPYDEASLQI
jgi:poly-gamma-glutamate capsule biosynthesis protein CapA/YwtB (metallophosphatase superfamily)